MTMNSVTKVNSTTATPATTIKAEVLEIMTSLGVSNAEVKDLRDKIVEAALTALNDDLYKIGPDENWFNLWTIPRQHRSECWKGYMSRLHEWAWKYIMSHVVIAEFMVDDIGLENPMYSLPSKVRFFTELEEGDYILELEDMREAISYSSRPVWNVRVAVDVQPDGSERSTRYITVDTPDGECTVIYVGALNGHVIFMPDAPIGNVSATADAMIAAEIGTDEAAELW